MEVNFSDYINDAVRILVLLDVTKERKSVKMTENKIKLYDYYLKFPCTMLGDDIQELNIKWNFDEYYAFFHWQPDLIRYRQNLNYLMAKGFVSKEYENDAVTYKITDLGIGALNSIENSYKDKLVRLASLFIPQVIKLTESKIGQQINEKSKLYLKTGGVRHES